MATQSSSPKSPKTASTGSKKRPTPPASAKRTPGSAASARAGVPGRAQVQSVAETAVDLPVGAILNVTERISDLVEPWAGRARAEKQIKSYRAQLRRSLRRTERRGATARRRATAEARKTRTRVERRTRARAQDLVDQLSDQISALR